MSNVKYSNFSLSLSHLSLFFSKIRSITGEFSMFTRAIVPDDSEVQRFLTRRFLFSKTVSLPPSLSLDHSLLCFANTRHKYSPRCLPRARRTHLSLPPFLFREIETFVRKRRSNLVVKSRLARSSLFFFFYVRENSSKNKNLTDIKRKKYIYIKLQSRNTYLRAKKKKKRNFVDPPYREKLLVS